MPLVRKAHILRVSVLLLVLLSAACAWPPWQQSAAPTQSSAYGVPAARLGRLSRCVDITRWFWAVGDALPQGGSVQDAMLTHFDTYMSDADLELIHRLGFRCVRLSIEPDLLYHKATPQAPDPITLGYIDSAVKRLMAHDLAVIIDLHDDHPDKPFEHDPDYASGYAVFWQTLARHFSGWNSEMLFLEVLNEPVFKDDPQQWSAVQNHLLNAMRSGAPRLTLIATGPLWSSIDGLLNVKPAADPNVVYTFHFYEPSIFTHEGAEWWVDGLDRYMADLPYPSGSPQCAAAVQKLTNTDVRESALAYCASDWDSAKVTGLIARAAQWSKTNRVPITAGEFGVYCKHAPSADRLRWFRDVRAAFQRYGIGWTLWGYDDCYGLGRHLDAQGGIVIDQGVVQALGLNAAAAPASKPSR